MDIDFDSFVLAAATADLSEEPRAREYADAVEFRMDLADDPLETLAAYAGELPVIATNRADWEGGGTRSVPSASSGRSPRAGEAAGDRRLDDLTRAAEFDSVAAVDIELESLDTASGRETADQAREHGVDVIVSAHDFEGTPSVDELRDVLRRAADAGDVGKLAVTAEEPGDVLALLSVTDDLASDGRRVATMAMGEAGRHSRAIAPIYGSRIGYAPVDPAEATAPGQFDLATLSELIEQLDRDRLR